MVTKSSVLVLLLAIFLTGLLQMGSRASGFQPGQTEAILKLVGLRTEYKENPLGHRRSQAPAELAASVRSGAA